jgi:hypothetical protein
VLPAGRAATAGVGRWVSDASTKGVRAAVAAGRHARGQASVAACVAVDAACTSRQCVCVANRAGCNSVAGCAAVGGVISCRAAARRRAARMLLPVLRWSTRHGFCCVANAVTAGVSAGGHAHAAAVRGPHERHAGMHALAHACVFFLCMHGRACLQCVCVCVCVCVCACAQCVTHSWVGSAAQLQSGGPAASERAVVLHRCCAARGFVGTHPACVPGLSRARASRPCLMLLVLGARRQAPVTARVVRSHVELPQLLVAARAPRPVLCLCSACALAVPAAGPASIVTSFTRNATARCL